jgi:hypothetical protein
MNQTMFDVPDPLFVHVLLLITSILGTIFCLPRSWHAQCDRPCFFLKLPHERKYVALLLFFLMQSVGPGKLLMFICRCFVIQTPVEIFSLVLGKGFFCTLTTMGYTNSL